MKGKQKKVDEWNDKYPAGTRVKVKMDDGSIKETVTRSEADLLSGHTPVVWLEGIRGCYLLDRCTPVI